MTVMFTAVFVVEKSENVTMKNVRRMVANSKTKDLSSLYGKFTPTKADLTNKDIIREPKEFIETCSMNRRACTHK